MLCPPARTRVLRSENDGTRVWTLQAAVRQVFDRNDGLLAPRARGSHWQGAPLCSRLCFASFPRPRSCAAPLDGVAHGHIAGEQASDASRC